LASLSKESDKLLSRLGISGIDGDFRWQQGTFDNPVYTDKPMIMGNSLLWPPQYNDQDFAHDCTPIYVWTLYNLPMVTFVQ